MSNPPRSSILTAARHALFWLMLGNAAGLWLSLLLLNPSLNGPVLEFTYGRIVPLHLNFHLYGWAALPLLAWLFHLFDSPDHTNESAAGGAVLAWSLCLGFAGLSWLNGNNGGKIFLEWEGSARVLFTMVLAFLWSVLASRWAQSRQSGAARLLKGALLVTLLPVPLVWYWAASPAVYPAVNPTTSGPTAASLLGSTLVVIFLLLIVPLNLGTPKPDRRTARVANWVMLFFQAITFLCASGTNSTHRSVLQVAMLGLLLLWLPFLFCYFRAFSLAASEARWLWGTFAWFCALTVTGWVSFLPNVLDSIKFTDGLVAHSHLAMAGFVTSFNFLLLSSVLRRTGLELLKSPGAFLAWHLATVLYVVVMWVAGFCEASDPAFTITAGATRTALYALRTAAGSVMFLCSFIWWWQALEVVPLHKMNPEPEMLHGSFELAK